MGSVKDLKLISPPEEKKEGVGDFAFSDRFSVFDWGEMPDLLEDKGKALCVIGAYFFELFEKNGIPTHYLGLVQDGKACKLSELKSPVDTMRVKLVRVIHPNFAGRSYDYSPYKDLQSNFLLPLEIIYRNKLIENSSLMKRIKAGVVDYRSLGFNKEPVAGEKLEHSIFDASTKLESTDRYISWQEAQEISAVSSEELEDIQAILQKVNCLITGEVEKLGLENVDGKIELGFDASRKLLVLDVAGTLDECRFMKDNLQLSKELLRVFYRDTDWAKEVEAAKKKGEKDWKKFVSISPPNLPKNLKKCVEDLYRSFANEITGKNLFDCPPLQAVIKEIPSYF